MAYSFYLSQPAEEDILEAYRWYEQQRPGLGEEFFKSFDIASQSIVKQPSTYPIRYKKKVRAFLLDRFPFLILYIVEEKAVNVISVFNTSRDPKIWKQRIK